MLDPSTEPRRQEARALVLALAIVIALVAGAALGSVAGPALLERFRQRPAPEAGGTPSAGYYCPMHPDYRSDRPGDCPICNMKLVPLASAPTAGDDEGIAGRAAIVLRPERRQLIGVTTAAAEKTRFTKTIRAVGRVEADETKLSSVTLKAGGWIEELRVGAVGERVRKGEPLLVVYSPEILDAERDFRIAVGPSKGAGTLPAAIAASARERLHLLDLSDSQIEALERGVEPSDRTTLVAKSDGVVTTRNVVLGSYVEPGRELLQLADLSTVWVQAAVFEHELAGIVPGLSVAIAVDAWPGETTRGTVQFVAPTLDEATRTVRVRVAVPNSDGRLKPGMYATATIEVDGGVQIVVDESAVLDTGSRQIVFVDAGEGRLVPREVRVGERSGGRAVVLEGLAAGETIVTSGNFLVDSESRLRAAAQRGAPAGEHHHER